MDAKQVFDKLMTMVDVSYYLTPKEFETLSTKVNEVAPAKTAAKTPVKKVAK